MGLFDHFPYTNVHELNLDWILSMMKALEAEWEAFTAGNSLIFADPLQHDISKTYAKNTIVLDGNGNAYVSLQAVPVGVGLQNGDYWLMVFDYEAFIERVNKNFTARYYRGSYRATAAMNVGDWLTVDDILCKATAAIAVDDVLEVGVNITHFTLEDFIKAFMQSANQLIQQYKNDIDASELAYRQQLAQDIANTTASLQAQLDAAISGATVDSEVINARVSWNNITYPTLGDAIREQTKAQATGTINNLVAYKDAVRGFWSGSTFTTNGDYSSYEIPVTAGDVVYIAFGGINTIIAFLDSSHNYVTHASFGHVVTVPSNPAIAYMSVAFYPHDIGYYVASTDDFPSHPMSTYAEDGADINIYDNFMSNDDDFMQDIISRMIFPANTQPLYDTLEIKSHHKDSVSFKAISNGGSEYWDAFLFNSDQLTFVMREGGLVLARCNDAVISLGKDGKLYVFDLNRSIGAFSLLATISGISSYNMINAPVTVKYLGNWQYSIEHCGYNDPITFDISTYISNFDQWQYLPYLGFVWGANNSVYINQYQMLFTIFAHNTIFNDAKVIDKARINIAVPASHEYVWTQKVAGLRMLADAQGCYFIPFNALGIGVNRGNGLHGDDYISDQIHPTQLGGYNIAIGVWSHLKNIPCWYTSIPSPITQPLDGSQWSGKIWYAYGTSETAEASGHFANYVATMSGMTLTNKGIGGGALVNNRNIYNALLDLTDGKLTADLITIEVGANDIRDLGSPFSTDPDTFFGALNHCIKEMYAGGVQAQIVIMCSYPSRYAVGDPSDTYDVDTLVNTSNY